MVAVPRDALSELALASDRKRVVVQTTEYHDVSVPLELLIDGGRLDIYPELLRTSVLRTYSKDGRLLFQAGGWIGLIPINDRVALEIRPRVPIANLERILYIAGDSTPIVLKGHLRAFDESRERFPQSLLDVLAERLSSLAEACWNEGLHADYVRSQTVGHNPRGRVLPFATVRERLRTNDRLAVVAEQFWRTHDTAPNQCLAVALDRLHRIYAGMKNRAGARALASKLARARQLFVHVQRPNEREILLHPLIQDPTHLPSSRPSYPAAVALAKIVLSGAGVDLRSSQGGLSLPPMMISMEVAFERYVRNILSNAPTLLILDGNAKPPAGAKTTLFHTAPPSSPQKNTPSTPDIVCASADASDQKLVIDVKYKPDIDRDDVNQVLGYALTFRARRVVLACPRKSANAVSGLQLLGIVSSVEVYQYFMDLGTEDLQEEELGLIAAVESLLVE